jgi:hypothetical protein
MTGGRRSSSFASPGGAAGGWRLLANAAVARRPGIGGCASRQLTRGWRAADPGELYDQESIFSYIDGHAEVYLAYGMTGCLARRYNGPPGEAALALDVFEVGSPADAYGVASYDRETDHGATQGSTLR